MKRRILALVFGICLIAYSFAQKAIIKEQKMKMKTYMFSDPDPVPDMTQNYPYFRFDGYTNRGKEQEWNMVIMENDYIKVFVNTDVGGKIWGAVEKSTGNDFLYFNDVVKFRDVAIRGPWTSGGLEFNYGIMSHTSTCSTPQDYVLKENPDGSVSCIIGAIDLHTNTKWNVEINLPEDKAYVETKGSWFNTGNVPVPFYHYSNAAAKSDGNLEFIFPGDHYIGHDGSVHDWPVDKGRAISFYENNNFGGYKSYHVINAYAGFMGGYYHNDDFGFGNLHNYDEMPGQKLWIWGLSQQGMIWEDLLTDTNGQYIEYQTGATFNQPNKSSSLTPYKHREFVPYDSDLSSEIYFPLKRTGGMVAASKNAVLNILKKGDGKLGIRLSALAVIDSDLLVKQDGQILSTTAVKLNPLELMTLDVELDASKDFSVELGDNLLQYSSKREDQLTSRPTLPNKDFDWDSAIGHFTLGLEAEKLYVVKGGHPWKVAQEHYLKSLEKDPAFAPALNRVAYNFYRMMEYDKALEYTNKSLSIDTYDPEANYLYGIINTKLGKTTDAKSGFSIASQATSHRTAAYTELAKLYLNEKNYSVSLGMAEKAIRYNQTNMVALQIKALAQRLMYKLDEAKETLSQLHSLDNTSAFVASEEALLGIASNGGLAKLITNELKEESYLDLALQYHDFGLQKESISVLKQSPKNAKILLLLAYLDRPNRTQWLKQGIDASPMLIFPFRTSMYEALKDLMASSDYWKLKYYTALILWKKESPQEAKQLMLECGNNPDFAPFYLAKADLFADDRSAVKTALDRAKEIDGNDWRVNLALVDFLLEEGEYQKAAGIAKKSHAKHKEISILGMRYASSLLKLEKYRQCLDFLENFEIIPFEGAVEGRQIYFEATVNLALESLQKKDYQKAMAFAEKAKLWPKKLGSGRPYNPDERLNDYIIAHCQQQLGNQEKEKEYLSKIVDYKLDPGHKEHSWIYLQCKALKTLNRASDAEKLIQNVFQKDGANTHVQWIKEIEEGHRSLHTVTKELEEKDNKKVHDNLFLLMIKLMQITNGAKA